MIIAIKVVSDRTGNGLKVQLAAEETSSHIDHVNRSVEERGLWLPDGSEVYTSVTEETCVRVPDQGQYLLTDAYHIFGKYSAQNSGASRA